MKGIEKVQKTKSFNSLKEFKSLLELPDTKPLALINSDNLIAYSNQSFELLFGIQEGRDFTTINSDPNLDSLLRNLVKSNYASFHFDFFFSQEDNKEVFSYFVDVDRVMIETNEYLVLVFSSQEEHRRIEDRINNLHNALEHHHIPGHYVSY